MINNRAGQNKEKYLYNSSKQNCNDRNFRSLTKFTDEYYDGLHNYTGFQYSGFTDKVAFLQKLNLHNGTTKLFRLQRN